MNYFKAEKVNDHVTCIRSNSGELLYLMTGSSRALLMDTCIGVKGLRAFVDGLTDLPYDVVLSHGHIDHAMGAPEFSDKKIYMRHADLPVYHSMQAIEGRLGYALGSCPPDAEKPTAEDLVPPAECDFIDPADGMNFDLGGLNVEIVYATGHTPGCIALLLKEERTLILGDAGNTFTFLFDKDFSSPVSVYREMLLGLKDRVAGKIDRIYLCHVNMEVPPVLIDELIEVCDDILSGKTDDIPFEFMGQTGAFIAKAMDPVRMCRVDGKLANIIYRKDQL